MSWRAQTYNFVWMRRVCDREFQYRDFVMGLLKPQSPKPKQWTETNRPTLGMGQFWAFFWEISLAPGLASFVLISRLLFAIDFPGQPLMEPGLPPPLPPGRHPEPQCDRWEGGVVRSAPLAPIGPLEKGLPERWRPVPKYREPQGPYNLSLSPLLS